MSDLRQYLNIHTTTLTSKLKSELETAGAAARRDEDERYRSRQGEVSALIAENILAKLEREIDNLRSERKQGLLFDEAAAFDAVDRSIEEKHAEIARRTGHYEEVRAQLERERSRVLHHLLPKRYSMTSAAQVFPVTLEVVLPVASA